MKKFLFLIGGLLSSLAINAQIINYSDTAILFSSQDNNGTARFNAMSGAFGALGGDLSAGDINPAGLAIFKNSEASISFGLRDTDITTTFAGTSTLNNNNYFNLNQGGGVLVFNIRNHSGFKKIALGLNYSVSKNFENSWLATGSSVNENGNPITPLTDFYDPDVIYPNAENQAFENFTDGANKKLVLTFAAQANDKLYIGASLTTHDIEYNQIVYADEFNNDGNGNTFDVSAKEQLITYGTGVSLNFGLIARPSQEVRLGVSVQSPTWYELSEEFTTFDDVLFFNSDPDIQRDLLDINVFDYNVVSPAKLTGSFAYLFGKEGLLSFDYTYTDFKNTKLKPTSSFTGENQDFSNLLKGTSQFRVGAEWRLDNVSLRGGYHFEENPYKDAFDSDDITGYSLGIGFKFKGNMKLDLAYQNSKNTSFSNLLGDLRTDIAELDTTNDKFTATLVIGL